MNNRNVATKAKGMSRKEMIAHFKRENEITRKNKEAKKATKKAARTKRNLEKQRNQKQNKPKPKPKRYPANIKRNGFLSSTRSQGPSTTLATYEDAPHVWD